MKMQKETNNQVWLIITENTGIIGGGIYFKKEKTAEEIYNKYKKTLLVNNPIALIKELEEIGVKRAKDDNYYIYDRDENRIPIDADKIISICKKYEIKE